MAGDRLRPTAGSERLGRSSGDRLLGMEIPRVRPDIERVPAVVGGIPILVETIRIRTHRHERPGHCCECLGCDPCKEESLG